MSQNPKKSRSNSPRQVRFQLNGNNESKETQNPFNIKSEILYGNQMAELLKISLVKLQEKQYPTLVFNYDLKADDEGEEEEEKEEESKIEAQVNNDKCGCHGNAESTAKINNSTDQPTETPFKRDTQIAVKREFIEVKADISRNKAKLDDAKKQFFTQNPPKSISTTRDGTRAHTKLREFKQTLHRQNEKINLDLDLYNSAKDESHLPPPKVHQTMDPASFRCKPSSDGGTELMDTYNKYTPSRPPVFAMETDMSEVQETIVPSTSRVAVCAQQPQLIEEHRRRDIISSIANTPHLISLRRHNISKETTAMDDVAGEISIPMSSEVGQSIARVPSEHELSISRSLQKLDLPDWFKNSTLNRHGSRDRLLGASRKSGHQKWADFKQKSTSMSSLPVIRRPSTPASVTGSSRMATTPNWQQRYRTPTSPSPASSPFSRRTSRDELSLSGNYFQFPSASYVSSSRCTSPFCVLGGFNYERPYTGWRSSERLARENAVENEDDVRSYDHSFVTSSSFYWSPEERLSSGPGYYAMKFGIHPGIFSRKGSRKLNSGNFDEQLSSLMSANFNGTVNSSINNTSTSFVRDLDMLICDSRAREMTATQPEVVAVKPKAIRSQVVIEDDQRVEGLRKVFDETPPHTADRLIMDGNRHSSFTSVPSTKSAQPWSTKIGETTFPTFLYRDSKEAQTEWNNDVISDDQQYQLTDQQFQLTDQQYELEDGQPYSRPLSSSSPIPSVQSSNEFQPIIYDLSMVDSRTAAALGLPVPHTKSASRFTRTSLMSPITRQSTAMATTAPQSSSISLPLSSSVFSTAPPTTTSSQTANVFSTDPLESSLSESEANEGDDESDDNSSSDESVEEEPISPPKFSSLPKMTTTTTIRRSNGQIADIVTVSTDTKPSSKPPTTPSNLMQPLKTTLSLNLGSVTPSSTTTNSSRPSSTLGRPASTPVTTTTFITTMHREGIESPSQQPIGGFLPGKTNLTLTLLNENIAATSPKKSDDEKRTANESVSSNSDVRDLNPNHANCPSGRNATLVLHEDVISASPELQRAFKAQTGTNTLQQSMVEIVNLQKSHPESHPQSSNSAKNTSESVTIHLTKSELSQNDNENVFSTKKINVSSPKTLFNQTGSTEFKQLSPKLLNANEIDMEGCYNVRNGTVTIKSEENISALVSLKPNLSQNSLHRPKQETELNSADNDFKLTADHHRTSQIVNEKIFATSQKSASDEISNGIKSDDSQIAKTQPSVSEILTGTNVVVFAASNAGMRTSLEQQNQSIENQESSIKHSLTEPISTKSASTKTKAVSSDKASAELQNTVKIVKQPTETNTNIVSVTEPISTKSVSSSIALSDRDVSLSAGGWEESENTAKNINRSMDSWQTRESRGHLTTATDNSVDMSLGTFVHRIGYTAREANTSYDDTNSVFSGVTDFDTSSVVRLRMTDEQRKQNRRNVRSDLLDETVIVRCAREGCKRTAQLSDARVHFKTCRNCYTYYCSHHCRKDHKEQHKRQCLHGRSRQVCKQALNYAKENEDAVNHLSGVARQAFPRDGRGYVRITLPSTKAGLKFIRRGISKLEIPATYFSKSELTPGELGDEVCSLLMTLCDTYDTEKKFVLLVTMFLNKEVMLDGVPHWERNVIAKCAKVKLQKVEEGKDEDGVLRRPRSRRGSTGSLISRRSWRMSLS